MSAARVYLDHNASAPLRPAARDAMLAALECVGNPSSVHAEGRATRALISAARRQVAGLVGADPRGVIFTSSATEAVNLALSPGFSSGRGASPRRLLASTTEHACVLGGHRFEDQSVLRVSEEGLIDPVALDGLLAKDVAPVMLALQAANNETGVLQPVREAADRIHATGGVLVCDAVQAAGRIPVDLADLGADMLILSSHKIGGPKGAGALILADLDAHFDAPLVRGGGQESGFRAGTEDAAAIAGFAAACVVAKASLTEESDAQRHQRDRFERELHALRPDVRIFGSGVSRLPNTSCFALPGESAATLLMALDLAGVAVSAGRPALRAKLVAVMSSTPWAFIPIWQEARSG